MLRSLVGSEMCIRDRVLCDYILYVDHNPRKAMELCAECTKATGFDDWWWKARLGKCYYQLGLMRDAEKQFKSSLKQQENIATLLELGKVYLKLDQPLTALELFEKGSERNPRDHHLVLGMARIYDLLSDSDPVSYTHLTLPTKRIVENLVVDG
eukprot:TRINITY_DN33681_c0_g1_i1.p1 TRINITY_DN33681_c0_g1~~TRINITY_DN33681_c0_g1_i1.p1  ORF type:complete len:154 (-),score=57.18 TRINITY_DN33681_c0_g1_i1:34-495(-)